MPKIGGKGRTNAVAEISPDGSDHRIGVISRIGGHQAWLSIDETQDYIGQLAVALQDAKRKVNRV